MVYFCWRKQIYALRCIFCCSTQSIHIGPLKCIEMVDSILHFNFLLYMSSSKTSLGEGEEEEPGGSSSWWRRSWKESPPFFWCIKKWINYSSPQWLNNRFLSLLLSSNGPNDYPSLLSMYRSVLGLCSCYRLRPQ